MEPDAAPSHKMNAADYEACVPATLYNPTWYSQQSEQHHHHQHQHHTLPNRTLKYSVIVNLDSRCAGCVLSARIYILLKTFAAGIGYPALGNLYRKTSGFFLYVSLFLF